MTHLWKRNEDANRADYLKAWCGRSIRPNTAVTTLTRVDCQRCREAYARALRALPDVFPTSEAK